MKKQYEQVQRFHAACGIGMPKVPTILDSGANPRINNFWAKALAEASEKMKAVPATGGEVKRRASFMLEELSEFLEAETIEGQADALIDLIYFAIGTFTLMGINPAPLFEIVAAANLGKIMPDGTVLRNKQGKIQKPPGWKEKYAPEGLIRSEIENQRTHAARS